MLLMLSLMPLSAKKTVPLPFFSAKRNDAKLKFSIYDEELYGIVRILKECRPITSLSSLCFSLYLFRWIPRFRERSRACCTDGVAYQYGSSVQRNLDYHVSPFYLS